MALFVTRKKCMRAHTNSLTNIYVFCFYVIICMHNWKMKIINEQKTQVQLNSKLKQGWKGKLQYMYVQQVAFAYFIIIYIMLPNNC